MRRSTAMGCLAVHWRPDLRPPIPDPCPPSPGSHRRFSRGSTPPPVSHHCLPWLPCVVVAMGEASGLLHSPTQISRWDFGGCRLDCAVVMMICCKNFGRKLYLTHASGQHRRCCLGVVIRSSTGENLIRTCRMGDDCVFNIMFSLKAPPWSNT